MDQLNADALGHKPKKESFFSPPLFVGFNPKGSDSDSVRSPTSPLDFGAFSNLGNFFRSRRSSHERIWYRNKVGLSIVDSIDFEAKHSGKVLRASDSRNILFRPQLKTNPQNSKSFNISIEAPNSLPKNVGLLPYSQARPSILKKVGSNVQFKIGDFPFEPTPSRTFCSSSFDSRKSGSPLHQLEKGSALFCERGSVSEGGISPTTTEGSNICVSSDVKHSSIMACCSGPGAGIVNIPPSEIELSEDYTCVRTHGPNPKVTHIFGDCILECKGDNSTNFDKNEEYVKLMADSKALTYPSSDFLRFCYSCKKNLEGEDIYIYRGEKAFCSCNCRLQEILIDEEMEKTSADSCEDSSELINGKKLSQASFYIST